MNNIFSLITADGFIAIPKSILKIIKDPLAVLLYGYLIDKYRYFESKDQLININGKDYFFNISDDIEKYLFISYKLQQKALKVLTDCGLVEVKLKGTPAKKHFHLSSDNLLNLLEINTDREKQVLPKSKNYNSPKVKTNIAQKDIILLNNKITQEQNYLINKEEEANFEKFAPPPERLTSQGVYDLYKKQGKINYRGNLFFKQNELETLKSKWNADKLDNYFDRLDNWLNTPKNWKLGRSHYLTVNDWIYEAYKKALLTGYQYQVDLEWKANNNEKDYTDIDMSKQMLVEDF